MRVLVDTPVWSLALRRQATDLSVRERRLAEALTELIREGRAQIVGAIRQELLSGIRDVGKFEQLRLHLRAFDEPAIGADDYEEAARMHNRCQSRGIAGSAVDLLICAVAERRQWQVFTTDRDFERYRKVLAVRLYEV
jgi:predicted nucleic acid-binding protein